MAASRGTWCCCHSINGFTTCALRCHPQHKAHVPRRTDLLLFISSRLFRTIAVPGTVPSLPHSISLSLSLSLGLLPSFSAIVHEEHVFPRAVVTERRNGRRWSGHRGRAQSVHQQSTPRILHSRRRHIAPHVGDIAAYAQHSRSTRDTQSLVYTVRNNGILADQKETRLTLKKECRRSQNSSSTQPAR